MNQNSQTSILKALEEIAQNAPQEGITLSDMFKHLDERAFGAMLFALALPCCIPFLYIVPQIVSLPMTAIAFQMVLGREEPWLPEKFATRKINKEGLDQIAKGGRKYFGWAEIFARPRLTFLTGKTSERLVGILLCLFCLSILLPIPGTNTVPGFGVALVAFGLMARDGLMVLGGLLLGSAWITLLLTGGLTVLKALIGG